MQYISIFATYIVFISVAGLYVWCVVVMMIACVFVLVLLAFICEVG
jgi:hypothetical protein